MTTYLVFTAACVLVVAAMHVAADYLSSASRHGTPALSPSSAVYRDQLTELETDVALGKVAPQDASALRTEIARRLLAEDRKSAKPATAVRGTLASLVFLLIIPAIALPAYVMNGTPEMRGMPHADRLEQATENNDMAAMIARVEDHLKTAPNDVKAWTMLAPFYMQMARYGDAAVGFERVLQLETPTAEVYASLGEAMVFAEQGLVSARATRAFTSALGLEPDHPKANYYTALALQQDGKMAEARARFETMLQKSSPDAPWRAAVQQHVAALAKAPALSDGQISAGENMAPTDRAAMIRSMVDGLEARLSADGKDIDGWLRLIRARTVLGETGKAKNALAVAVRTFNGQPQALAALSALARELQLQ